MNRILELRQQRAALIDQARVIVDTAATDKRAITTEENEKFDKLFNDADDLRRTIEAEERQKSMDAAIAAVRDERKQTTGEDPEQRAEAFRNFIRVGTNEMTPEQRSLLIPASQSSADFRAQGVVSPGVGGAVVPQGFYAQVIEALKWYGGMFAARTNKFTTAMGNDLPVPTANDTTQVGELLAENTQANAQDVTFSSVTFKAYKYSSKVILVSFELLQDAGVDIEAFLVKQIATRLGRIQNTDFTTGTGIAMPKGVVADATLGKTGTTGQTGTILYADVVDLKYSVDKAYRNGAEFMFNDATMRILLKLVDGSQRPLFYSYTGGSLQEGEPDRLMGSPIVINNDISIMQASAKSILYGDFSTYWIRTVQSMMLMRLVERYADYGQVGFLAFMRTDGRMVDAGTHPIKYYANPSS
jgi:HK97 family phage major capsid protein